MLGVDDAVNPSESEPSLLPRSASHMFAIHSGGQAAVMRSCAHIRCVEHYTHVDSAPLSGGLKIKHTPLHLYAI